MRADRRRAILDAASELIAERGYARVTLEAVCERAACSKSAIYAGFGDKAGLLLALVEEAAGAVAQAQYALHLPDQTVTAALRHYAGLVMARACEPAHLAIVKAVIGLEAGDSQVARRYGDVALAASESALSQFLAAQTAAGELAIADPYVAARQFHALVLGWDLLAALLAPVPATPAASRDTQLDAAVELFVACYALPSDD